MKSDDSSVTRQQYEQIRAHAKQALEAADALGSFPTPVDEVMAAAKLIVADEDALNEGFLSRLRRKASGALKSAVKKVLGVLDVNGRIVYIDRAVYAVRQTFLKLHEAGHAILPWQRKLYAIVEDCEKTIAPDISEMFDRQANVFATEVLFQLDCFTEEARAQEFGIKTPMTLSKKYGASVYATIRRYVAKSDRSCAVLILNPPEMLNGFGFRSTLRRVETSSPFRDAIGQLTWQQVFTPSDDIGAMIPVGKRRMTGHRQLELQDANGCRHECLAEAFKTPYQVFILIVPMKALTSSTILMPGHAAAL